MRRRPTGHWKTAASDESGSILVLVLVFLALFGILVGALLAQSDTNLKTTSVIKTQDAKVYAADAGIEYGIQTLRADPTYCVDAAAGTTNLPDLLVNGVTVKVTCRTSLGYAPGTFGWAVIANDTSASAISTGNGQDKAITGPVFNTGGWNLQKPLHVNNGDVYQRSSSCPGGLPSGGDPNLSVAPNPPYRWRCTTMATPNPTHVLPAAVPPTAPPSTMSGTCRPLYPATYRSTNPPNLQNDVYMASGVYYFENLGDLNVGKTLFGGQPLAGDSKKSEFGNPCRSSDPVGATGLGVELILGGNTTISVGNNSTLELYTRQPTGTESPGITLYQVPANTGSWIGTTVPATTKSFFSIGNGNHAEGIVHGAVYAPAGTADAFSTNASKAVFWGGTDVFRLNLQSSASATGLLVTDAAGPGHRVTLIEATAKGVSGAKDITARAVVDIANDVGRTSTVGSWWTRNP